MASEILKRGAHGERVRELQLQLRRLGYDLAIDGVMGRDTEEIVVELQTLFGLEPSGAVGHATQRLIGEQLATGWNVRLPNAQELALKSRGSAGGIPVGRLRDASDYASELPRAPGFPDAQHTAVPTTASETFAPRTQKPTGAPGDEPSSTLPKHPPQGSPLKR